MSAICLFSSFFARLTSKSNRRFLRLSSSLTSVLPFMAGSRPWRTVSTSGNSGIFFPLSATYCELSIKNFSLFGNCYISE